MANPKDYKAALASLKLPAVTESPHVKSFLQKILYPLAQCEIMGLFQEDEVFDARTAAIHTEFEKVGEWQEPFRKLVKSSRPGSEDLSLAEAIRLFGNRQGRLWLMTSRLSKGLKLKELAPDLTTGRHPLDYSQALKYAIAAQTKFGEDSRYKDVTFAAGFLFDYLNHLHHSPLIDMGGKKYDDAIGTSFTQCLEAGQAAIDICRQQKKVSMEKFVPAYPLIVQAGRICMMILVPGYAEFLKKVEKEGLPAPIQMWREKELFGVPSNLFGQLLAQIHPVFDRLGDGVLLHGHPYTAWVSGQKDVHDLTAIGMFAMLLKSPAGKTTPDGAVANVICPELKHFEYKYSASHLKKDA